MEVELPTRIFIYQLVN